MKIDTLNLEKIQYVIENARNSGKFTTKDLAVFEHSLNEYIISKEDNAGSVDDYLDYLSVNSKNYFDQFGGLKFNVKK